MFCGDINWSPKSLAAIVHSLGWSSLTVRAALRVKNSGSIHYLLLQARDCGLCGFCCCRWLRGQCFRGSRQRFAERLVDFRVEGWRLDAKAGCSPRMRFRSVVRQTGRRQRPLLRPRFHEPPRWSACDGRSDPNKGGVQSSTPPRVANGSTQSAVLRTLGLIAFLSRFAPSS